MVVGRLDQREATDVGIGLKGRDGPLQPARLVLDRVVDTRQILTLHEVIDALEAAVRTAPVAAV